MTSSPLTAARPRGKSPKHPFDLLHGTDTGALIQAEDLATGHRHDRHITAYHGTAPSLFRKALARWRELAIHPVERTAFLDIGAGKGRAMLLAAELPFRRIVGVELHPALAATARTNIDRYTQGRFTPPVQFMEADVMDLRIPAGPCLFFLFNPFGAVLLDRFLMKLIRVFRDRPGELDLIYINDEQHEIFREEYPGFRQLWRGRLHMSVEDRVADRAIITHHAAGVYVTVGYEDCSMYRFE